MKKTLKNLAIAFIGESQARNRYTFYAKIAQKEGFEQIAEIFRLTADQEKEHASWLFKLIQELKQTQKSIVVEAEVPTVYKNTEENLKAAIEGEKYEQTKMYPDFSQTAKKEGLGKIATRLGFIALAEKHHQERYEKLLKQCSNKSVFKKEKAIWWVCRECGYVSFGKQPPTVCPSCGHPQSFYQRMCEEY